MTMKYTLKRASVRSGWARGGAALLLVAALTATAPASGQQIFPTPEAAVNSLVDGLARHDNTRFKPRSVRTGAG